jgi:hypothetical protein
MGLHTWASIRPLPPDQLLRRVFESCGLAEAKDMLENTPVARPVIYLLERDDLIKRILH